MKYAFKFWVFLEVILMVLLILFCTTGMNEDGENKSMGQIS